MSTINGIGTGFVGCSDVGRDGSYVTTEWVMFFLPIAPTRSLRILPLSHTSVLGIYSSTEYQWQRVPLYWTHVFQLYGTYVGAILYFWITGFLDGPKLKGSISSPLLAAFIAFLVSVLALGASYFIRKGSTWANLVVWAIVGTLSLDVAMNLSVPSEKTPKYLCFFWVLYFLQWGARKFFGGKDQQPARRYRPPAR